MTSQKRPHTCDPGSLEEHNSKRTKLDSNTLNDTVKDIMAAIYFDINCVCIFRGIVRSDPEDADIDWYRSECNKAAGLVSRAVALSASKACSITDPTDKRIKQCGIDWTVFSMCAHSEAFRRACLEASQLAWDAFLMNIQENSHSIEVFARTRNLDWHGPLLTQPTYKYPDMSAALGPADRLSDEHPHHFVQTPDRGLRYPTYEGYIQTHMHQCSFNPAHWEKDYPDPTIRTRADGDCHLCMATACKCELGSLAGNLIELVEYENKGTGVRALTNFTKGDILDQFVGEIRPPQYPHDEVYGLEHPEAAYTSPIAALISPKRRGNWTRFINHSCNASTVFELRTVGTRTMMTIETDRDISFGEEITVDYGSGYWKGEEKCQCGEKECCSLL